MRKSYMYILFACFLSYWWAGFAVYGLKTIIAFLYKTFVGKRYTLADDEIYKQRAIDST